MNTGFKYTIIALGVIALALILWFFKHIVAYILISGVLSLVGKPLVDLLKNVRYKKFRIPSGIAALFTLVSLWVIFYTFIRVFVPLIINEANELSHFDTGKLLVSLNEPITKLENVLFTFDIVEVDFSVEEYLSEKLVSVMDISIVSGVFSSFASLLGNLFIAFFAISFITFFFLKDNKLFNQGVLAFVPDKHIDSAEKALKSTRRLLMRYFIGIGGQITGIIMLVTLGLTILGIEFSRSLVIGLMAGIMNVIPYLGPVIGSSIGILMGAATHLHLDFMTELLPFMGSLALVFVTVQVIDNVFFQPLIYSSSVNAHPLEIFLVIMMAGSLAGIPGMILAIPTYTVIRVFAKEFFNKFKIVKKLTKNIE